MIAIRYELMRIREKTLTWIAWRLPRSIAYWATVRVLVADYDGNPSERPVLDALNSWGTRNAT